MVVTTETNHAMRALRRAVMLPVLLAATWSVQGGLRAAPPSVKELARQLREGDRQAKRDAAYALAELGDRAKPALPELIEALKSRDAQIWFQSVTAIARIGPTAKDAVPVLIEQLKRWSPQQRYRAAMALARIGRPAIRPLTRTLAHSNAGKRAGAAMALGAMGPAAASAAGPLVRRLEDSVDAVREQAAGALARIGSASLEPLADALTHKKRDVRAAALDVLHRMGKTARPLASRIEEALRADDPQVRAAAIRAQAAVSGIGNATAESYCRALADADQRVRRAAFDALAAVPAIDNLQPRIVALLDHDDRTVRRYAVELLALHRKTSSDTVPRLVELARRDAKLRPEIERCLVALGPAAADEMQKELPNAGDAAEMLARALGELGVSTRKTLLASLRSPDSTTRATALRSLAQLRPEAKTVEAIRRAFRDDSPAVRAAAAASALRLLPQEGSFRAALLKALEDSDQEVRRAAIPVLAQRPPNDGSTIAKTAALLKEPDTGTRRAVLAAIGSWKRLPDRLAPQVIAAARKGPAEQRAAAISLFPKLSLKYRGKAKSILVAAFRDKQVDVRLAAVRSVETTITNKAKRIELLRSALDDPSSTVRADACRVLGRLGREARRTVPKLLELVGRKEDEGAARQALQSIGAAGPEAVPILRKMLHDRDPRKRGYAVFLLGRVEPAPKEVLAELKKLEGQGPERFRRLVRATIRRIEQD